MLAAGTAGQVLTSGGAAAPSWTTVGKTTSLPVDTNLQTWADSLPNQGVYDVQLTVAQGGLPIGWYYIDLVHYSSGIAGRMTATKLTDQVIPYVYFNHRNSIGWTGWMPFAQAIGAIGFGQSWQNVTGSRVSGTTYYNTTGRPIHVNICCPGNASNHTVTLTVDTFVVAQQFAAGGSMTQWLSALIPTGSAYIATLPYGANSWAELR